MISKEILHCLSKEELIKIAIQLDSQTDKALEALDIAIDLIRTVMEDKYDNL